MTNGVSNELRLDLEKSTGLKAYELYKQFSLSSSPSYTLDIGSYTGTAGNLNFTPNYENLGKSQS